MASNTTYGDWMRPIRGGIRNISRPLTMIGFGVLAVTLCCPWRMSWRRSCSVSWVWVSSWCWRSVTVSIGMFWTVPLSGVLIGFRAFRSCLVSFRPAVIRRAWFLSVAGDPAQGLACGGE